MNGHDAFEISKALKPAHLAALGREAAKSGRASQYARHRLAEYGAGPSSVIPGAGKVSHHASRRVGSSPIHRNKIDRPVGMRGSLRELQPNGAAMRARKAAAKKMLP